MRRHVAIGVRSSSTLIRKGKPVARRGRKATDLERVARDSGAAGAATIVGRRHSSRLRVMRNRTASPWDFYFLWIGGDMKSGTVWASHTSGSRRWIILVASLVAASLSNAAAALQPRDISISGTPPTSVVAEQPYNFTPSVSGTDYYHRFQISNKPPWAAFNEANGTLSGTPSSANVGTFSNIVISVRSWRVSAALPAFSIQVTAAAVQKPTISGTPPTTVTAGSPYAFQPQTTDPGGGALSFSVTGKPSWASFSIATGQLWGTPTAAGVFSNIAISVSNGAASASLAPFTITVAQQQTTTGSATLSWDIPTANTDGSPLTDLAGFEIDYGNSSSNLSQVVQVANPGLSTYVMSDLASGTWYFAVKAYTTTGTESASSAVASKVIP